MREILLWEEEEIFELWGALDFSRWDSFFLQNRELLPEGLPLPSDFVLSLAQGEGVSWAWGQAVWSTLQGAALDSLKLFVLVLGGGCLMGLIAQKEGKVTKMGAGVLRLSLWALVLLGVLGSVKRGLACLNLLENLYRVTLGVSLPALVLLGSPGTATVLGAAGELLLGSIFGILQKAMVPLTLCAGVLGALDSGEKGVLYGLSQLGDSLCRVGLRVVSLVYMLISGLLGRSAVAADGVLLRTGKAAAGALPALGGLVSDSMEAVAACVGAVKGGMGTAAVLFLLLVILTPAVTLLLQSLALRSAGAFGSALGAGELSPVCASLQRMLSLLASLLIAGAAMGAVCLYTALGGL